MAMIPGATWGTGSIAPSNKGRRWTHQFIKFVHLRKNWQLLSGLEDFVILRGMWQTSERIFFAFLQRRQEYDVERSKNTPYHDLPNLFSCNLSRQEAE
jgi:hypothetical protein